MISLPTAVEHRAQTLVTALSDQLAAPPLPVEDHDRGPTSPRWRAQSLSKGAAGVATLHTLTSRHDRAHAWIRAATREPLAAGGDAGLWYGAPSVAFALLHAPYRTTSHARLDTAVTRLITHRLATAHERLDYGFPRRRDYDIVLGLSGLGAYLLHRDPEHALLTDLLAYLVRLTYPQPAPDGRGTVPGWWTTDPPPHVPHRDEGGHGDLGAAHGIPGVLSLLALTWRSGIRVAGHAEAMDRIATWMDTWRHDGSSGPWWPQRLTLDELRGHTPLQQTGAGRPSWCYGTPGIARALQLHALAIGDGTRQRAAETALLRCLSDPSQTAQVIDPAVCHGGAGVLATTWCAAADADIDLNPLVVHLVDLTIRLTETATMPEIGLVEGRAGIAATLHTLTRGSDPRWMSCLLIR